MILITGGMGFIGLHTARRFLDAGEAVVLTQYRVRREPTFLTEDFGGRARVESLDITDGASVQDLVRRRRVTDIVHLAVPGLGALSPADDYRVNMTGLLNVLEAAQTAGVRRVCLASSMGIYGSVTAGPFQEAMPLPVESGGATEAFKKAFEILGLHYADRAGMDVVALRIAGIYGPLYHSMANLPSRLCHAAVRGERADYSGARGGSPHEEDEADLCYVKDCARAIQMVQTAPALPHRIYNIGGGRAVSNRDLAEAVRRAVPDADLPMQPGRSARSRPNAWMDLTRIRADTGYEPEYDIERGIAEYIAWLRHNPQ
jgi:UDP-glucose 4-epimerase